MTMAENELDASTRIRRAIGEYGKLPVDVDTVGEGDDLYRLGLTSHASVNLMLALENEFDLEFPERMLRRQTFQSIDAIRESIEEVFRELD
jgi:acyl carrier protein